MEKEFRKIRTGKKVEKSKFEEMFEKTSNKIETNNRLLKQKMLELLKTYKISKIELKQEMGFRFKHQPKFDSFYMFCKFVEPITKTRTIEGISVELTKVNLIFVTHVSDNTIPAFYNTENKIPTDDEMLEIYKLKTILNILKYDLN